VASLIVPAAASNSQAGLMLRRTRFVMDDTGQVWLSAQFLNDSNKPIGIHAVAPAKTGPWTSVGQTITPGATVRGTMKISDGGPSFLWVDSTLGLLRFELPHSK
jgi:hypothetical protein